MFKKVVSNFCSNTTIHGFSYTVQPYRNVTEKIFWMLSVSSSFIITGILINELIVESLKNPIIIFTNQHSIKVSDIDFPAVSLCPNLLYKTPCKTLIQYYDIKDMLQNRTIGIKNLTLDELKMMQVLSLAASDEFLSDNYPSLDVPVDDFMDILERFNIHFPNKHLTNSFVQGLWQDYHVPSVRQVLSRNGFCYTFNLPDVDLVYRHRSIFKNYTEMRTYKLGSKMLLNEQLGNNVFLKENPLKVKTVEDGLELSMSDRIVCTHDSSFRIESMSCSEYQNNSLINTSKRIFPVKISSPFEVISGEMQDFYFSDYQRMILSVTPKITEIDESMEDVSADERACYLPHERKLEFFKIYNKINCEHECLARMTVEACGCVQFFMARNKTTRICGTVNEKCFRFIEERFQEVRSTCKCYDACNNIKYEVTQKSIETSSNKIIDVGNVFTRIEFAVESVFPIMKKKSQTVFQFLSFIGGLLGLFAGFSVLSAVEIIYFFILYPLLETVKRRSTRVHPFERFRASSRTKTVHFHEFFKELLGSSTIHTFNHIGSETKILAERLIWIIIFITSMTFAYFSVESIFTEYKEVKIVMRLEGSPTKVEDIPFPALTIIPDLYMDVHNYYADTVTSINYSNQEYYRLLYQEFTYQFCPKTDVYSRHDSSYSQLFYHDKKTDIQDMMRYYSHFQPSWTDMTIASWNVYLNPPFARTLTSTLPGWTYNMIDGQELLHTNVTSKDFHYSSQNQNYSAFPWFTSSRSEAGLKVETNFTYTDLTILDYYRRSSEFCSYDNTFIIHSPYELPLSTKQSSITYGTLQTVFIIPEIIKSDESLRSVDINIRKCYFEGERRLKYFKIYTQQNCELECLSHVVSDKCGCIPYSIIRNQSAQICYHHQIRTCAEIVRNFINFTSYDHLFASHGICNCLPSCNYVKYTYEGMRSFFVDEKYYNNSLLEVKWKDGEYFALVRYENLGIDDLLSYVGGILGLFAGISVHSIFELFYFFTLRLVIHVIKAVKRE